MFTQKQIDKTKERIIEHVGKFMDWFNSQGIKSRETGVVLFFDAKLLARYSEYLDLEGGLPLKDLEDTTTELGDDGLIQKYE